jgi:arsenite oxidase small subunit
MTRCNRMVDGGRRKFLGGAGLAAAGAAASTMVPPQAKASPAPARVDYPANRLPNVGDLRPNEPLHVAYPDADAPGVLLKLGKRVQSGFGPNRRYRGFHHDLPP